jgi:hypothetical protein
MSNPELPQPNVYGSVEFTGLLVEASSIILRACASRINKLPHTEVVRGESVQLGDYFKVATGNLTTVGLEQLERAEDVTINYRSVPTNDNIEPSRAVTLHFAYGVLKSIEYQGKVGDIAMLKDAPRTQAGINLEIREAETGQEHSQAIDDLVPKFPLPRSMPPNNQFTQRQNKYTIAMSQGENAPITDNDGQEILATLRQAAADTTYTGFTRTKIVDTFTATGEHTQIAPKQAKRFARSIQELLDISPPAPNDTRRAIYAFDNKTVILSEYIPEHPESGEIHSVSLIVQASKNEEGITIRTTTEYRVDMGTWVPSYEEKYEIIDENGQPARASATPRNADQIFRDIRFAEQMGFRIFTPQQLLTAHTILWQCANNPNARQ